MKISNVFKLSYLLLILACSENKVESKLDSKIDLNDSELKFQKHPIQYELKDSLQLTHIKNEFYRNKYGFLYERTISQREFNGRLKAVEYFNGMIPQEINPKLFQQMEDSWFAEDGKNVYYFCPTSGGVQIAKIENADVKTFKILDGNYKYAADKHSFFYENKRIADLIPSKTKQIKDRNGKVIKLNMKSIEKNLEP